jgi:hypothetical protein
MGKLLTWAVGPKAAGPGKPANGSHRPCRCRDSDCLRPPCRWCREGYEDGYGAGFEDGHDAGYSEGYAAGAASAGK